jgi:hypothetical protein
MELFTIYYFDVQILIINLGNFIHLWTLASTPTPTMIQTKEYFHCLIFKLRFGWLVCMQVFRKNNSHFPIIWLYPRSQEGRMYSKANSGKNKKKNEEKRNQDVNQKTIR